MRYIFFAIISLSYFDLFSQDIPSDSIILRKIFGMTDIGGKTVSFKYLGDENIASYQDSVVYKIVFKSTINLKSNKLILAIVEAPYGTLNGHQFGFQNFYFFKLIKGKAEIVDSIKSDGVIPIGDASVFEIVDIGKGKKAIVSTFQSTGNHHFESTQSLSLLELNQLTYLFAVNTEYDNSCCIFTETDNDSCEAERYEEVYEIVKSKSLWYNIKVYHKDFRFTKDCQENFVKSESVKEYIYFEGKYIEKINNANNR